MISTLAASESATIRSPLARNLGLCCRSMNLAHCQSDFAGLVDFIDSIREAGGNQQVAVGQGVRVIRVLSLTPLLSLPLPR